MTANQVSYFKVKEDERHHLMEEAETQRANKAQEYLTGRSQDITNAHYLRSDVEAQRSNKAREAENYRSNRAQESISWARVGNETQLKDSSIALNRSAESLNAASERLRNAERETEQERKILTSEQSATEVARQEQLWSTAEKNRQDIQYRFYDTLIDGLTSAARAGAAFR